MAPTYRNFIFAEDQGFIFAYVPKAACTNWKAIMRYVAGLKDWQNPSVAHDEAQGGLRYLDPDGPDEELARRPDLRRYAMVRNPFSRILSAYLNKIEKRLPLTEQSGVDTHFDRVVREIDVYRRDALGPVKYPEINFEVFLRWYRDSGSWAVTDEHWTPQHRLLRQPGIKYDHIARFENIPEDANKLLRLMGCDVEFPTREEMRFKPNNAGQKLAEYYDPVTAQLVAGLFAQDFDLLGYSPENRWWA